MYRFLSQNVEGLSDDTEQHREVNDDGPDLLRLSVYVCYCACGVTTVRLH